MIYTRDHAYSSGPHRGYEQHAPNTRCHRCALGSGGVSPLMPTSGLKSPRYTAGSRNIAPRTIFMRWALRPPHPSLVTDMGLRQAAISLGASDRNNFFRALQGVVGLCCQFWTDPAHVVFAPKWRSDADFTHDQWMLVFAPLTVARRLGLPIVGPDTTSRPCPTCGLTIDAFGDHVLACQQARAPQCPARRSGLLGA